MLCFGFEAQNLITNPSFEDIDSCYGQPAGIGFDVFQWSGCTGWSNPIKSSSDLWCADPVYGNQTPPFIPGLIYQNTRTGENMAGILGNDGIIINYREYIQNELIIALEEGKKYKLIFFYSSLKPDCSMNVFQALFLPTKMNNSDALWLTELTPSASSNPELYSTDTLGWNYGEMIYTAKGGEMFLIFGNFQDTTKATYSEPCDTSFWGNISYAGNYFVLDDFSLEELPLSYDLPNVFSPNNDGVNDLYNPKVTNISDWKMEIVNRWGEVLAILDEQHSYWDGKDTQDGVYFYKFWSEEFTIIEQGFISLVR
jgi:gliding motility-associated-like protein